MSIPGQPNRLRRERRCPGEMGIRYKFGRPPDESAAAWLRAPILLDIGAASGFYLVPPRVTAEGMHLGLKIGDHSSGPSGDPDRDREPGAVEVELVLAQARSRLPRLDSYRIAGAKTCRSEEHTSELQSRLHLVCRLLLEKKKKQHTNTRNRRRRCAGSTRQDARRRG